MLVFLSYNPALNGQVAGRWRVILRGGIPATILGELWLAVDGATVSGTVDLAGVTSGPRPLTGRAFDDDRVEWLVTGSRFRRFTGRLDQDSLVGEAFVDGGERRQWVAERLADSVEFYASLPRFTQRQVLVFYGVGDSIQRLPGAWLRAASERGHTNESVIDRYRVMAHASGLTALSREDLGEAAVIRAMGLRDREAMVAAHRTVLATIRRRLVSDSARKRFDFLFRPTGEWHVDIHDVALHAARQQIPGIEWASAEPALAVAGRLPRAERRPADEVTALELYRLFVLSRAEPEHYSAVTDPMQYGAPASFRAVQALLVGYESAVHWYEAVMRFLVTEPWLRDSGVRSLADIVQSAWPDHDVPVPDVRAHLFGYAEGAPVAGVFSEVLDRLIVVENPSAARWLARHGQAGLRQVVQEVGPPAPGTSVVDLGTFRYEISSIGQESARARGGFLEARDVVLIDPSTMPLFAIGTVLHEWHHIVHGHLRTHPDGSGLSLGANGTVLTVTEPDLYLAEGLAEYEADRILRKLAVKFPLIAFGEAEKLAEMAAARPLDPHIQGYLMIAALADAVPEPAELRRLVMRRDTDAFQVILDSSVAVWFPSHGAARDLSVGPRRRPVLIPEVTFTVDDGQPFVEETRYLIPPDSPSGVLEVAP
ncbi:MAG: hypothetical protein E4H37_00420 [Gemmatimonadales bacterium]|nr:MAG: hypothetical protein E4H37_00420 [Gemmatimonadales bacterium]